MECAFVTFICSQLAAAAIEASLDESVSGMYCHQYCSIISVAHYKLNVPGKLDNEEMCKLASKSANEASQPRSH